MARDKTPEQRAITAYRRWCKRNGKEYQIPSVEVETIGTGILDMVEVTLSNVNGLLAIYRVWPDDGMRKNRTPPQVAKTLRRIMDEADNAASHLPPAALRAEGMRNINRIREAADRCNEEQGFGPY